MKKLFIIIHQSQIMMNRLPKHITLKHLNAFVAVAQEGSFTRAAQRLFQTQSSVTGLIQQLETALGTSLFSRTSRRVILTPIGQKFLPRVTRLLTDFDSAVGDVVSYGTLKNGQIRIAAALSAITGLIADTASSYVQRYPDVRLYLRDDNAEKIQHLVATGEVDFGLTSRWTDMRGLICDPLLEDQFGVLYRNNDSSIAPDADGYITWSQLENRRLVGVIDETGIMAALRSRGDLPVEAAVAFYETSSISSQVALVMSGLGMAVLPALAAHRVLTANLSFSLLRKPSLIRTLCFIFHQDQPLSPTATDLVEEIRYYVKHTLLPEGCNAL